MKHMLSSRMVFLAVLAGIGLASGCAQNEASLAPVSGKVTVDGKPLSSGSVSLVPDIPLREEAVKAASKLPKVGMSGGKIEPDGTYKIYTDGKEGAPLGKYKVRIMPQVTVNKEAKEAPDIGFKKEYTDANKTPLRFEVVNSPQPGSYDLKLKK